MMAQARFVRQRKRTIMDIYNKALSPRIEAKMNTIGASIKRDARKTHEFKNRTGALEESINFTPVVKSRNRFSMTIFAGGWARTQWAYDYTRRRTQKTKRRNVRYQRGERFNPRAGQGIYVNYAPFVENKGYSVLKKSVERFQPRVARLIGSELRFVRV